MSDQADAEIARLRRQVRAMSAVTRQLQAQLASAGRNSQSRARRTGQADSWLPDLERLVQPVEVAVLALPDGQVWLREGDVRRRVRASLLTLALEQEFGARHAVEASELEQWVEGPPVEVFETSSGPPFLIVGGRRLPLRGLPTPYPVPAEAAARFPEGNELDVWRATRARRAGPRVRSARDLSVVAHEVKRRGKQQIRRITGSGG